MKARPSCRHSHPPAAGFSLVEVLVSVLLVAVGLLGVSKMQAAGVSNSQTARTRALIAFQASSLGALIHGNRAFWSAAPTSLTITAPGSLSGSSASTLSSAGTCLTAICTPAQLAAFDISNWATHMATHFPTYVATIQCDVTAPATDIECQVGVQWDEKYVAVNRSTGGSAAVQAGTQLYTLVVRP